MSNLDPKAIELFAEARREEIEALRSPTARGGERHHDLAVDLTAEAYGQQKARETCLRDLDDASRQANAFTGSHVDDRTTDRWKALLSEARNRADNADHDEEMDGAIRHLETQMSMKPDRDAARD